MTRPHIKKFLQTPFRSFFALWIPVLFSMVAKPLTGLVDIRNVELLATSAGVLSLIYLEMMSIESLTLIWWITGGWLAIRGIGGVLRIWPGSARSPLGLQGEFPGVLSQK